MHQIKVTSSARKDNDYHHHSFNAFNLSNKYLFCWNLTIPFNFILEFLVFVYICAGFRCCLADGFLITMPPAQTQQIYYHSFFIPFSRSLVFFRFFFLFKERSTKNLFAGVLYNFFFRYKIEDFWKEFVGVAVFFLLLFFIFCLLYLHENRAGTGDFVLGEHFALLFSFFFFVNHSSFYLHFALVSTSLPILTG